ncbi:MAG: OsmC family protein, partial [Deltaproteobacteria bacterium]|nr:OsmC family protein [Deltaproteobacteria bacterium]
LPSRVALATDAPVDNQGRGESFSPTDLLATSLATCMLTTMGIVAQREGWAIEGATAAVEKHMGAGPRRVARLFVGLSMPAGPSSEARTVLEDTARTCPVAQSIHPDIQLDLEFDWGS